MTNLPALSAALVPIGSLDAYIHHVNQIPMLTLEEEQNLTGRLFNSNDLEAAKQLILPHLRFVVRVAQRYAGYGLALSDLIQEGNIGLMKAVRRFDPRVGVRLVTFAVHWIKAEIHEFILRNWRIVKIATTKAQRKLFFNLRSAKNHLGMFTQQEADEVAKDLGVSSKEVYEMEQRLHAHDKSFDLPVDHDTHEDTTTRFAPSDYLEDETYNPAIQFEIQNSFEQGQEKLYAALQQLDTRSRNIIEKRWLNVKKQTLEGLAAKYKVSAERIRQLELSAMGKLKKLMEVGSV